MSDSTQLGPQQNETRITIPEPEPSTAAMAKVVVVHGDVEANQVAALKEEHARWCDQNRIAATLQGARWGVYYAITRLARLKQARQKGRLVALARPMRFAEHSGYAVGSVYKALTDLTTLSFEALQLPARTPKQWRDLRTMSRGQPRLVRRCFIKVKGRRRAGYEINWPLDLKTSAAVTDQRRRESQTSAGAGPGPARESQTSAGAGASAPAARNAYAYAYAACAEGAPNADALDPDKQAAVKFLLATVRYPESSIRRYVRRFPAITEDQWRRLWAEVKSRKNVRNPGGLLWKLAAEGENPTRAPWLLPQEKADQQRQAAARADVESERLLAELQRSRILEAKLLAAVEKMNPVDVEALSRVALELIPANVRTAISIKGWRVSPLWKTEMANLLEAGWNPATPEAIDVQ